jgi:hypothetical protein
MVTKDPLPAADTPGAKSTTQASVQSLKFVNKAVQVC